MTGSHPTIAAVDTPDRLLTTRQLADYLSVPVATLYAWRHGGDGPPGFRIGKHLRYRSSDVNRWIQQRLDTTNSRERSTATTSRPLAGDPGT